MLGKPTVANFGANPPQFKKETWEPVLGFEEL